MLVLDGWNMPSVEDSLSEWHEACPSLRSVLLAGDQGLPVFILSMNEWVRGREAMQERVEAAAARLSADRSSRGLDEDDRSLLEASRDEVDDFYFCLDLQRKAIEF